MHLNLKLPSRHSSSSSGSLKILNLNDLDHDQCEHENKKDLFDLLLEDYQSCNHMNNFVMNHTTWNKNTIIQNQQIKRTIQVMNLSPRQLSHQGCKCTKIDCLKLYCECFAKGKLCTQHCICVCCKNNQQNIEQIYHAKQLVNFRHPNYFYGIPAQVPARRCTCKKSQCKKKYCECFSAGFKCTEDCQCCDCHNGKEDLEHEYYKGGRMEIQVRA